jgi:hypothetical protein
VLYVESISGGEMSHNPYDPPVADTASPQVQERMGFVRGWTITDLVLCASRILFLPLSVIGWMAMVPGHFLRNTILFEIGSQAGILLFGVSGNILLLLRKRLGIVLGAAATVFTAIHIATAIYQLTLMHSGTDDPAKSTIVFISAGLTLLLRIGLNVTYVYVLLQHHRSGRLS